MPVGAGGAVPSSAVMRRRHWLLNWPGQSVPAFHWIWRSLPGVTPGPTAPWVVKTGTFQVVPPSAEMATYTVSGLLAEETL